MKPTALPTRPARSALRSGATWPEWSPDVAEAAARRLGVGPLGDRHWRVIASFREEVARSGRRPRLGRLQALTGFEAEDLRSLFPGNTEALIARIAGLPAPHSRGQAGSGVGPEEEE